MNIEGLYPILVQAADGAAEGARESARAGSMTGISIAGMVMMILAVLSAVILAVVLVWVLRTRPKMHERIVSLAIQHNQPEVAREIMGRRPLWLLWIVLGIVAIVVAANLSRNLWALSAVAILAIATAPAWLSALTGTRASKKDAKRGTVPGSPVQPAPPASPAAPPVGLETPAGQEGES